MKKTSSLLVAAVAVGSGCVLSMGAVMVLGLLAGEEVASPVAGPGPAGGSAPAAPGDASLAGTWSTTSLGLQPYDTATGTWGPLNAEGRTLTLRDDGTFESVWVKSLRGTPIGTWLAGDWELDGDLLTLRAQRFKSTTGGQPALERAFRVSLRQEPGVAFLSITDVETNVTEQLRRE